MSGHDITTAFMIATTVMVVMGAVASYLERAALEVFSAAMVVFVFTVASRAWSANTAMPLSAAPWPLQDAICGLLAIGMFTKHREWWKLLLATAFGVQCAAHVVYWWTVFADGGASRGETVGYLWIINTVFAAELLILTVAGGRHIASHVLYRLRLPGGGFGLAYQRIARGK